MRIAVILLPLLSLSSLASLAQTEATVTNPLLGSWTLNVAESSIDYAPLPRSEHRTYEALSNNGMTFSVEGIDGAGDPYAYGSTAAIDGNEYAMPGSGTRNGGDTVSWTFVDANSVDAVVWKLGEVVNRARLAVSNNGTLLTITENGISPDGTPTHGVRIYDRQPREQQLRSVREILGSWELIEWHVDGEVLVAPQVEGRFSIRDGVVMWIIYRKTDEGEVSNYGFGEYEIDDSKFVYGYDRTNLIEIAGDRTSASRSPRPRYDFFPRVVGAELYLDDDSHNRGFILVGDRLTFTIDDEIVRVYRRLSN